MIGVIIDSFYLLTIEIALRVFHAKGDFKSLLYLTNSPTVIQFMMIYYRKHSKFLHLSSKQWMFGIFAEQNIWKKK